MTYCYVAGEAGLTCGKGFMLVEWLRARGMGGGDVWGKGMDHMG